jgi:putative endopeptidase
MEMGGSVIVRSFVPVALAALALAAVPGSPAAAERHGVMRGYMDTRVAPCEDFYRYANGAWLDTVSIPAAYTVVGAGRDMLDRNQAVLHDVLDAAAANYPQEKDPTLKKLGALYASLMDSARAEREGAAPLAKYLKDIDALKTPADVQRHMAWLANNGVDVGFGFGPLSDLKNAKMVIGTLFQGGLGLPDRDYYFRTDPKSDTLRQQYVVHIERTFVLAGVPAAQAKSDAQAVMKLETALAESALTRVELRDPERLYHKMTVADLQKLAPGIQWLTYFKAVGASTLTSPSAQVNVATPKGVAQAGRLLATVPVATWRAYMRYHLVDQCSPWLSQAFFDENFSFSSRLSGARQPLPRWKRSVGAVDEAMGEALGKAYVARAFPPESKQRMLELVDDLVAVMHERISANAWMSDTTKGRAQEKLAAFTRKIGYPDEWRDYSALAVDAKLSAIENLRNAQAFEVKRQLAKIDRPLDRKEWGMTPPTVNAYYNAFNNEVVFPAGILQPPQFDPNADDALNYGGIGMVIGHELTHGFDDQGRKFDGSGNLSEWWTAGDDQRFRERADKVASQYDGYVAVDTLHLNGRLTLGENIADLGGLTLAFYAYQRYLQRHGRETIEGFTPEQRFFLGAAQAWRRKVRPEAERTRTLSDPHSPAVWRINGPMSNMKEFRQAFGCKDGDRMVNAADRRAEIW